MNVKKPNQRTINKPRVYVDFNEMIDFNLVLLSQNDFKLNSNGEEIKMVEGKKIDIYDYDVNTDGLDDNLVASGTIERNNTGMFLNAKWLCRIDENGLQHESDLI